MIGFALAAGGDPLVRSGGLGDQFGYSDEVVGDHTEGEGGVGAGEASDLELGDAADGLGPAECLFDAFPDPLADLVSAMAGSAPIDSGLADLAELTDAAVDRDVQGDLLCLEFGHEGRCVEQLVSTQGHALAGPAAALDHDKRRLAFRRAGSMGECGIDDQAVSVLHQRMAKIGKLALLPVGLPEQSGVGIGGRGMGLVRALLLRVRLENHG